MMTFKIGEYVTYCGNSNDILVKNKEYKINQNFLGRNGLFLKVDDISTLFDSKFFISKKEILNTHKIRIDIMSNYLKDEKKRKERKMLMTSFKDDKSFFVKNK